MPKAKIFTKLRKEYTRDDPSIRRSGNPIKIFQQWFREASKKSKGEPNAMALATAGRNQKPSCRVVLLKGVSPKGFSFFTNYKSSKAREISQNRMVSLLFYWPELQRQIRIDGRISKVSSLVSDRYFASRPRGAQLGAWASNQSQPISNYRDLLQRLNYYEAKFSGKRIPRPSHWGGYTVEPTRIEFWQGRVNRLHERVVFQRRGKKWISSLLSP